MASSPAPKSRILLGTIASVHGIRGELVIRSYTAEPQAIASYGPLSDARGIRTFKLRVVRVSPKGVIVRIDGIGDRNAAEALRGTNLYVDRAKLPATEANEFYHADLAGLEARDGEGRRFGSIVGIANYGAGDLVEVRIDGGKDTEFVPFTDACVPQIDVAGGFAIVLPPPMTGEPEPAADSDEADEDIEESN